MRPIEISIAALTDDVDGIAEAQTLGGAGNLSLDGALVSGGVATAAEAQIVTLTSVGNDSGITFTITGKDADGTIVSETKTGPNATTVTTTGFYTTVTQIAASGATAADVTAGWVAADGAVTKSVPTNWRMTPYNQSLFVDIDGAMTYTVQHTESNPQGSYTNSFSTDATWRATTGLAALSVDGEGNIAFPVRAVRLNITAYTSGTSVFTSLQSN